jgi:hypothetical protein
VVAAVTITNPGSGYTTAPTVSFSGGGGTGAAATATVVAGCCVGITEAGPFELQGLAPAGTRYNSTVPFIGSATVTTCPGIHQAVLGLNPAPGYVFACCGVSGDPCKSIPLPATLFLDDGQGVVTLTCPPGGNHWTGTAARMAAFTFASLTDCTRSSAPNAGAASVTVTFTVGCGMFASFAYFVCSGLDTTICPPPNPVSSLPQQGTSAVGGGSSGLGGMPLTVGSCNPYSATTITYTFTCSGPDASPFAIYGGGVTIHVYE